MNNAGRYVVSALVGALGGYLACNIAANLEEFQFYAVRRWATGKSAMADIVHHPADAWIIPAIAALFILSGAVLGVFARCWYRSQLRFDEKG